MHMINDSTHPDPEDFGFVPGVLNWCVFLIQQEFVNPDMVPFVLPSALYIAQEVSVN